MKKLMIAIMFLFTLCLMSVSPLISFCDNLPTEVRVIYNTARVYSVSDLTSLTTSDEIDAVTIYTANLHEVLPVVNEVDDFYEVTVSINETTKQGYILKTQVINNDISSPKPFLQTNGYTITTTNVYEEINNVYIKQNFTLKENTPIRILNGYNASSEYTFISFKKDKQINSYYVKTSNIKANGISPSIIWAILIIIACVGIGSILLKILKPKKMSIKN